MTKTIKIAVYCAILIIVSVSCNKETSTTIEKKVAPWFVYQEGNTFKDIAPVKELISSISVFGNPPRSFIDECHQNNIEVYKAVGGNEKSIDTPQKIESLVEAYVDSCKINGYDGIDLDFEHLSPDIQDIYSEFLKSASQKLHAIGKKLSHCVGFYPSLYLDHKTKVFYDPEVLSQTCDLVRVMCYDMYFAPGVNDSTLKDRDDCSGVGPTSNYSWTKEAMLFWMKYIPKEKLVMALPAYANDYTLTGDIKGQQIYRSQPDSIDGAISSPIWLCYEKVNMYLYDDLKGDRHLFYASDDRSTKALLELADELKIYQIGFWHFDTVDSKMWNVTDKWKN